MRSRSLLLPSKRSSRRPDRFREGYLVNVNLRSDRGTTQPSRDRRLCTLHLRGSISSSGATSCIACVIHASLASETRLLHGIILARPTRSIARKRTLCWVLRRRRRRRHSCCVRSGARSFGTNAEMRQTRARARMYASHNSFIRVGESFEHLRGQPPRHVASRRVGRGNN